MTESGADWAIVLAAGNGTRLRSLTTDARGNAVPKQYCSLHGGPSLLQETMSRALAVVAADRMVAIVAEAHRQWWTPMATALPATRIVSQPRNRGTGNGILLPLLHVLNRDPDARITVLPSDHHVRREGVLRAEIRRALRSLAHCRDEIILLGIEPDEVDPELGYIQPAGCHRSGLQYVGRFVEKPDTALARELIGNGGVWNSFIMAGRAQSFLDLYVRRFPEVVMAMVGALQAEAEGFASGGIEDLYADLPEIDFSRHVLTDHEARLRLLTVPACGWSDLGTPERVARTLQPLPVARRRTEPRPVLPAYLDLATAHFHTSQAVA